MPIPLCKGCKWFGEDFMICTHPESYPLDPVLGEADAKEARAYTGKCGPKGALWEKREE